MTRTDSKPATWFWIVSILALVWNLMGVMAYIMQVMMSPEEMQALPENQRTFYESTPAWATGAFAVAVWGGAMGCILLLLRRKLATPILIISLAGILVQMYHSFFVSNSFEVFGPGGMIMPIMVLVIAIGLIWFARKATAKGWMK
ncbi:MAG TPA: hypothetical protein PLJ60_18155 [Chryseolinea sp.]|nr:hypothetical protein [Chryseolinea sp.]HPM32262.1 hypothetical protein [Chryseolinea sp.]